MKPASRARHAALCGAFSFAALASIATAQNLTWIRQIGTTHYDWASAAAHDGAGGVYVCGTTYGSLGGPSAGSGDAWLARYDNAGNQTWIRQLGTGNGDDAYAAASDGSGGVYVGGRTNGSLGGPMAGSADAWLARYDSAGTRTWIRQLGTFQADVAFAAASDGLGGVYVCGSTYGSLGGPHAGNYDVWLAHYDSAGNQSWIRQIGTGDWDEVRDAAPDGSGGVYLTGYTGGSLGGPNAGSYDSWLARYDSAGNQTWIRQLGTSLADTADAAASDGSGGVYVSGSRGGDVWLARYDSAGNEIWIRQFGTTLLDGAGAAAPDGAGGVYVSGATDGSLAGPSAGDTDAWLARYDGAGNRTWIRQLGSSFPEAAYAAASDGLGGVYVSGPTFGGLGGPSAGGDGWLARFDDSLTTVRYCTPAVPNSTGQPGVLTAVGSNALQPNDFTLVASHLSLNSFGFFLTSRNPGNVFPVSNSQGRLCLGGAIGRYVGPGQVKNSGSMGSFSLVLDLTAMPHPVSPVAVQPGETWFFQAWHRDANPNTTSNFTDALRVTFF